MKHLSLHLTLALAISAACGNVDDPAAVADATPVDAARLRDLKRRNKYAFVMALDTPDAVASRLARFVALTGDLAGIDQLYAQMEAVTPEDIMRAAKKYFTPERRTVVVLKGGQS